MEAIKYMEAYTPDTGRIFTRNSELGVGKPLKRAKFMVSANATITFVTPGGDTVSSLSVLAGEQYDIEVIKITSLSTGTVYLLHDGQTDTIRETTPGTQALSITFANVANTSMDVNFTNGSGLSRILVCRSGGAVNATPTDKNTYTANAAFGSGSEIGIGNFVVGKGSGPFTITGLTTGTTYHFMVFEYRGVAGQEKYNTATSTNNPRSQATT